MVVIKINGGLGNQLFQYSYARNLSLLNNTSLVLDISNYNTPGREFELDKFNIEAKVYTHEVQPYNIPNTHFFVDKAYYYYRKFILRKKSLFINEMSKAKKT